MTSTRAENHTEIIMSRVGQYSRLHGKLCNSAYIDKSWTLGGEGYLSTARDLAIFGNSFLKNSGKNLIPHETIQQLMWKKYFPRKGNAFGVGFIIYDQDDKNFVVGHDGDAVGGRSQLLILPEEEIVVVVICNLSSVTIYEISKKISELWKF
eukprot:TRINITY_DN3019_c0_g1_i3.p1 TRINITY_DN3019_c0_g1~~TRINITY_DN3019_c0_g1_i3.p1  ORF type:complete len:152 (-),score=42.62 TRINITY_DN3019_c0_g1_i3:922-1377(-)